MIKPFLHDRLHEQLIGTHICMTDSVASEIIGSVGYDFVWIDTEHSENTTTDIRHHLDAIQSQGTAVIVRVTKNDSNHTKHILELGPDGIVFPMINTAEEAANAMSSCLYPPLGTRGCGPLRATRYGFDPLDEYIETSKKICKFIQIETVEAVHNLPEIIKNPYIDGYYFGIYDLSGSVGKLGDIFGEETLRLARRVISILKDIGKPIAISTPSTDPEQNRFWLDLGVNIISAGYDYDYILQGAQKNLSALKTIVGGHNR